MSKNSKMTALAAAALLLDSFSPWRVREFNYCLIDGRAR